jgi:hypothetical protein
MLWVERGRVKIHCGNLTPEEIHLTQSRQPESRIVKTTALGIALIAIDIYLSGSEAIFR